jgi:O-antigen ligase/polysaccharide polymerase Wzy-like membrane protein
MTARFGWWALLVLAVGLALHNLVMAMAWDAGVRGTSLDVLAAWKDALLAAALAVALWGARRIPVDHTSRRANLAAWADRLALGYAAVVVLYWIIPQDWLGGGATARGELYTLRHHLLPVGAYFLGRLLVLSAPRWRWIGLVLAGVGAALAAWELADVYLVPLQWWRDSGVPGWFDEQLGLRYQCLSGLPENWIFDTGDENPLRRGVSTFLSPLATAYVLVVVLLFLVARRPTRWTVAAGALAYAGLLGTHTRAALGALALGLLVLAAAQRRWAPAVLAAASVAVSALFLAVFTTIGPSTSYTPAELACLRALAAANGSVGSGEASSESHWRNLRDGVETVLRHPWGYGLGNAGVSAKRTGVEIKAGESTYTELGVDTGLLGAALFVAWLAALVTALWRRSAWLAAGVVATAALGLQSDVIGIHWLAIVLFGLAGAALSRAGDDTLAS